MNENSLKLLRNIRVAGTFTAELRAEFPRTYGTCTVVSVKCYSLKSVIVARALNVVAVKPPRLSDELAVFVIFFADFAQFCLGHFFLQRFIIGDAICSFLSQS